MPPTINLQITNFRGHMLGEFEHLPVPTHTTPDGHIVVDNLTPIFETSAQAFVDTWQQHCAATYFNPRTPVGCDPRLLRCD